jgi:hypothetical protein
VDHVDREAGLFETALDAACDGAVIFDQKESHGFRSSTMGLGFQARGSPGRMLHRMPGGAALPAAFR